MNAIRSGVAAVCALLLWTVAVSAEGIAAFDVVDGTIPVSLTGAPGDPAAGRQAVINRKLGNCLACHAVADLEDEPFHGEVGPPLDGVADRWDEASLRMIVVNAKKVYDGTIMPAFHATDHLNLVMDRFAGKPILTAQQVENVVAYLMTLTE